MATNTYIVNTKEGQVIQRTSTGKKDASGRPIVRDKVLKPYEVKNVPIFDDKGVFLGRVDASRTSKTIKGNTSIVTSYNPQDIKQEEQKTTTPPPTPTTPTQSIMQKNPPASPQPPSSQLARFQLIQKAEIEATRKNITPPPQTNYTAPRPTNQSETKSTQFSITKKEAEKVLPTKKTGGTIQSAQGLSAPIPESEIYGKGFLDKLEAKYDIYIKNQKRSDIEKVFLTSAAAGAAKAAMDFSLVDPTTGRARIPLTNLGKGLYQTATKPVETVKTFITGGPSGTGEFFGASIVYAGGLKAARPLTTKIKTKVREAVHSYQIRPLPKTYLYDVKVMPKIPTQEYLMSGETNIPKILQGTLTDQNIPKPTKPTIIDFFRIRGKKAEAPPIIDPFQQFTETIFESKKKTKSPLEKALERNKVPPDQVLTTEYTGQNYVNYLRERGALPALSNFAEPRTGTAAFTTASLSSVSATLGATSRFFGSGLKTPTIQEPINFPITTSIPETRIRSLPKPITTQRTVDYTKTEITQPTITTTTTTPKTKIKTTTTQTQAQQQQQQQIVTPITISTTTTTQTQRLYTLPKTTQTPRIRTVPTLKPSISENKRLVGFDVFIRKKGKFVKANTATYSQQDALNFGSDIVQTTSAATFKIKPSTQKPTKLFGKPFKRQDFYQKGNLFIEKRERRIKSPGELREITFKGIQAKRGKALFKKAFGR